LRHGERRPVRFRPLVECLESRLAPSTFTVVNIDDNGPGSLRQAILDANANIGVLDTICFNIPGSGVHTITPLSPLPALTDTAGVVIDGYTQPGSSPNTLADGDNAVLRIELNGSSAGASADGLVITGGSTTVRGLVINGFREYGILLQSSGGNVIEGNFIGTDATGTSALGNVEGVEI
jgi:hypothetical protein